MCSTAQYTVQYSTVQHSTAPVSGEGRVLGGLVSVSGDDAQAALQQLHRGPRLRHQPLGRHQPQVDVYQLHRTRPLEEGLERFDLSSTLSSLSSLYHYYPDHLAVGGAVPITGLRVAPRVCRYVAPVSIIRSESAGADGLIHSLIHLRQG